MQKMILIIVLSFTNSIFSQNNFIAKMDSLDIKYSNEDKNVFSFIISGGQRLDNSSSPELSSNGYWGIGGEFYISELIDLRLELNFWKSNMKNPFFQLKLSVVDIPLLFALKLDREVYGFDLLIGLGLIIQNGHSDKLISLNFGGLSWLRITKNMRIFSLLRLQRAGSLEPGGGNTISSFLLGAGLQFQIKN